MSEWTKEVRSEGEQAKRRKGAGVDLKARICMAWDQRRRETSAEIARPKKLSDDVSPSSWSCAGRRTSARKSV
eukprot:437768-Rhodomonas_salina.1